MTGRNRGRRDIPVGDDGFVPFDALVERYHTAGDFRDSAKDSGRILPNRLTPDQAAEWWDDPSSCDIDGIDTKGSELYSVPFSVRGRKRKALKKVAFIGDRKEGDRIKRILADSFTADELELMTAGDSLIVSTQPRLADCTGYYLRKQDGVSVPRIVLEEGTTTDGIVHEAVHHLRVADGRTSFPTKNGRLKRGFSEKPKAVRDAVVGREESETVAETVARTRVDPVESGYYERIPGMSSRSAYLADQEMLSGSKALKGTKAIETVQRNYDRTTISRAIISGNRKKARR